MIQKAAVLFVAVGLLAGCGGGDQNAEEALSQTANRLGEIRGGDLDFRLVLRPRAQGTKGAIGFTLSGPFELGQRGELPEMRITYTQLAGPRRASATLVSDGQTAYAEALGRRIPLSEAEVAELRSATSQIQGSSGVASVALDDWIRDPELSDGGEVGGAQTDLVTAELDVVNATNGLLDLVRALGQDLPRITGVEAERLQEAVKDTSFELWTGKEDRLLRRLRITADLGLNVPDQLRRALGELVGASFEFQLGLANPKQRR